MRRVLSGFPLGERDNVAQRALPAPGVRREVRVNVVNTAPALWVGTLCGGFNRGLRPVSVLPTLKVIKVVNCLSVRFCSSFRQFLLFCQNCQNP